jgi:hypothetical protein
MSMNNAPCVLCNAPARTEETDHGNRTYFACTNPRCGDYEISKRAARDLEDNADRKEALCERVSGANQQGQVVEIFIAADGALQASILKRD